MRIIVRDNDSIVIWGTNDNTTNVVVVNNQLRIDGKVVATNVQGNQYSLITVFDQVLIDPLYVGYVTYKDGSFAYTLEYTNWLANTKNCLSNLITEYNLKAQDPSYTDQERIAFLGYADLCKIFWEKPYLSPSFYYPTPPDQTFPFVPACASVSN